MTEDHESLNISCGYHAPVKVVKARLAVGEPCREIYRVPTLARWRATRIQTSGLRTSPVCVASTSS